MTEGDKKTDHSNESFFAEDVADLGNALPQVRECYAYWRDLCAHSGGLPHHSMIRPPEIPHLLPYFFLVDLFENGKLMPRFRLGGSFVCQLARTDVKGKRFIDMYDSEPYRRLIDIYARIAERRLPFYLRATSMFPGRGSVDIERIMMPFGDEGGDVVAIGGVIADFNAAA